MERDDSAIVEERQLSSISKASSYEEMGEFWDTHDLADYLDQTHEVDFKVRKPVRHKIALNPKEYERAKSAAKQQGVTIEVIVRGWLEERLVRNGRSKDAARVDEVILAE